MRRKPRGHRRAEERGEVPPPPPARQPERPAPAADRFERCPRRTRLPEDIQEWIFERIAHAMAVGISRREGLRQAWRERFDAELPEWIYSYYALRRETHARREAALAELRRTAVATGLLSPDRLLMQLDYIHEEAMVRRPRRVVRFKTIVDGDVHEVGVVIEDIDGEAAVGALRAKCLLLDRLGAFRSGLPPTEPLADAIKRWS